MGPRAPEANARFTVEKARRGPKGLMTTSTLGSLVQFEDPLKSIQDSFVVVSRERCKKHTLQRKRRNAPLLEKSRLLARFPSLLKQCLYIETLSRSFWLPC